MVDLFVYGVFQGFFDVIEIKYYVLGVQIVGQFQVYDLGFFYYVVFGVQVGKVYNGQIFNEKCGYRVLLVGG